MLKADFDLTYMEQHFCSDSFSCFLWSELLNSHPEAQDSEGSAKKEKQMSTEM